MRTLPCRSRLHDSHYLPKSGYKKMRASDLKNPNPVVLAGGKAKQSSLQVRDYKFCGACEERFNKGGEAWILNKIPQNYGDPFWLHTLLNSKTPIVNGNDLLFSTSEHSRSGHGEARLFCVEHLLAWDPALERRSAGGRPPKLYLGRQERAIRAFLLGRGKLPEDVVVTVAVWPYKKVYPMAMMPRADAGTGYRSYWFYFFGFIFLLALGRKIPAQQRRTCSYHSPEKFLTLSLGLGSLVKEAISTELLSLDRSKIESMFKEIQAIRSKTSSKE